MIDRAHLTRRAEAAAAVASLHADDVDGQARFPVEAIDAFRQQGLMGILVPEPLGGPGASLADALHVCRILGQACGSGALVYAMHQIQVACLVAGAADDDWHNGFLKRIERDQLLLASVTSEVGIGGNIRSSICAPDYRGDRVTLTKRSSAISYGEHADALLVTARRNQDASSSDQVLIVAERGDARLTETSRWDTLGMRGHRQQGVRRFPVGGPGAGRADAVLRHRAAHHAADLAPAVGRGVARHRRGRRREGKVVPASPGAERAGRGQPGRAALREGGLAAGDDALASGRRRHRIRSAGAWSIATRCRWAS